MTQPLPNWENRLSETVAKWRNRPFRWDRDCGRWAAACVIAQTGEDPLKELRGLYTTKRDALRLLAEKPMSERLDGMFPRIHASRAQRGDLALMEKTCLGVVMGDSALFYYRDGMTMEPRARWLGVWAVGRNG